MKTTLITAVKNFINSVGEGHNFTTKQFTDAVEPYVNITRWNTANNNPFYRAHSYKTMIKKSGLISQLKQGLWAVEKAIPDEVTLTDFQYVSGYTTTYRQDKHGFWYIAEIKKNPFDFKAYLEGTLKPKDTTVEINQTVTEEEPVFGNQFTQEESPTYKTSYHTAMQFIAEETAKQEAEDAARITDSDSFDEIGNEIYQEVMEEMQKDMKVGAEVYIVDKHDEPDGSIYFSIIKDSIKTVVTEESERKKEVYYVTESGEEIHEIDLPAVFTDKKEMLAYVDMIS